MNVLRDRRDPNESALDSIEHELYDPRAKMKNAKIHEVRSHRDIVLPSSWGGDDPVIKKGKEDKGVSFGAKLLLLSVIFLFGALGFSAWRVMSLRNVVSATNIDMTADITPYIEGGEATPLILTLRNRNISQLENAHVTLLYKQGNGSQDEQEKIQEKRDLGIIKQNEYKKQDFSLVLYGSESETRDIVLKLEYQVPGSNAIFTKIVNAQVVLRTPPISVGIEGPDKLSVGQSGTYTVTVKNNSATTSLGSVLQLTLPNSFTIENTTPKPLPRSNSWTVGKLASGDTALITFTGSFDGKQGEMGTLQAKIGSQGDDPSVIGIVYAAQTIDVTLRSSPLTVTMDLSSQNGGMNSIRYNDRATLTFTYNNGSSQALEDVSIKVALDGDAAAYSSVSPLNGGYYDSETKTITWDKASLPDLAVLPPNSHGTVQVLFPTVERGTNSSSLHVTVTGNATTKTSSDVVTTLSKSWGVEGSVSLAAFTQYKNSPFPNSGPIPPQANKETTYTANLKVTAQNALSSAKVSFTLPAYVSWKKITSNDATISYEPKTRTVYWAVGPLGQGGGAEVNIMLGVKPSQSHVGGSPSITSGIILNAVEEVSKARIQTTLSPLTTSVHREEWPTNPSLVVGN